MLKLNFGIKRNSILKMALLSAITISTWSCGGEQADKPNVEDVNVKIDSRRLDKDLYSIDTNNVAAGLQQLSAKYPDFLNFYLDTLLGFGINGNFADTAGPVKFGVRGFITFKDYRGLYDTVIKHYPDTKGIDEELADGFKYTKHYFPAYKEPKVIYLISGLNNWGAFTYGDNILGIGLDMFLGQGYPFYQSVGIPAYMGQKLNRNYLPVAAFRAIHQNRFPFQPEEKSLLDMMIVRGKEMYFIDKVLPDVPKATKLAFTEAQLKWCEENEGMIYNFFVRENLLYNKEWQRVLRFVNDGPTSAGMPAQSPGNVGSWVGWQIVDAYVKQNPNITLQQLLETEIDGQAFLQKSKYKPR
ncbi:MAG: hypothetical protein EOP56_16215 [Sphingobacteriales bacterium]|nr:MAG: hypothetical protein EOP56_16215 [Sphingobacteriales bacterium]